MVQPFRDVPFKTAHGTIDLTLDQRERAEVKVAEFASLHTGTGSFGSGEGDDSPCFQRAFDVAYHNVGGTPGGTPTGVPHGYDHRHLNRPVRIPEGNFKCDTTLNLTRVIGPRIYGSGDGATRVFYGVEPVGGATITPLIKVNGSVGMFMERLTLGMGGGGGTYTGLNNTCMHLDWDGDAGATGGGGLRFNHFQNMTMGGGEYVFIIGHAGGLEGYGTLLTNFIIGGSATSLGIDIRGPQSAVGMIGGGVAHCLQGGVRCPAGGGSFFSQGAAPAGNAPDCIMESGQLMDIVQQRTESSGLIRMENGLVHASAIQNSGEGSSGWSGDWNPATAYAVHLGNHVVRRLGADYVNITPFPGTSINDPPESSPSDWRPRYPFAEINGGKFTIEASQFASSAGGTKISGTGGQVYIMGCYNGGPPTYPDTFIDYTGTIAFDPDGMGP